jgi:hypothetical protein
MLIVVIAIFGPFVLAYRYAFRNSKWFRNYLLNKRLRKLSVGREFAGWAARGLHEDLLVVDVSRFSEELVGVKRRRYGVRMRTEPPPEFPAVVEYISVWEVPEPSLLLQGSRNYLEDRGNRAKPENLQRLLDKVPDVEPEEHDRL